LTGAVSRRTIRPATWSSWGVFMHPVFAYIDIGSGSLIVSTLIAAIVTVPFVLRQQLSRIVNRLRGSKAPAAPTDADSAG
jgi:hypothetical protein